MNLDIVPLALTMMVGPQIMSAILFVASERAVRTSLGFVVAVIIGSTVGVIVMMALASTLDLGDPSDSGSTGHIIQYVLVGLLALAALKNYIRRETIEPPKWLGSMMTASPMKAFTVGLLLITLFPSDFVVLLTVGVNLAHNDDSLVDAIPFLLLTWLIAAAPLLAYLLFGHRARELTPKVRDWMNDNSWVINVAASLVFIVLILG